MSRKLGELCNNTATVDKKYIESKACRLCNLHLECVKKTPGVCVVHYAKLLFDGSYEIWFHHRKSNTRYQLFYDFLRYDKECYFCQIEIPMWFGTWLNESDRRSNCFRKNIYENWKCWLLIFLNSTDKIFLKNMLKMKSHRNSDYRISDMRKPTFLPLRKKSQIRGPWATSVTLANI